MTPEDPRHGTDAGYQCHRRANETPCDACRAARAAYVRDLRTSNPEYRERGRLDNMARNRAMRRLAKQRPSEFYALFVEELDRLAEAVAS